MMELDQYFRLFTDEELTRGAELFYSGDLAEIRRDAARQGHGDDAGASAKFAQKGTVTLSMRYWEKGVREAATEIRSRLRIHEQFGVICETSCTCEDFQRDLYGCPHTAALLTSYMVETNGEEVFRGTRLETMLRSLTNADDPFEPGALRRTDTRLLSLLKGNADSALPVWKERLVNTDPLEVECEIHTPEVIEYLTKKRVLKNSMYVALKAGSGRKYVIRDLPGFLDAYRKEETYPLGKAEVRVGHRYFAERSARILDVLSGMLSASEKGLLRAELFVADSARNDRFMMLNGPEFDRLMERCEQVSLLYNDAGRRVELAYKGLRATLRKKAFGASLQIAALQPVYVNGTTAYLDDGEVIFRVETGSTEKTQELLSLLKWTDELYVRESEIGQVCRNLLPVFEKYGETQARGLALEDYAREQPRFVFHLDYPADQELTCVPYAVYPKQDFRCLLYDPATEAGRRNAEAETAVAAALPELFAALDKASGTLHSTLDEEQLFLFMRDSLPVLESMGEVMATDALRRNRVRSMPRVSVGVSVESGHLLLSLKSTGLSPDEMSEILGAYRKKKKYYRLRSGEFLAMEEQKDDAWETVSTLYQEYGKKDPESIRLPAFRALYLQEMLENRDNAEFSANDDYRRLIAQMDPSAGAQDRVPRSLGKIIRPYQTEGFRWIRMLKRCGFGGILADDMGLGKTLQILAFLLKEKQEGKKGGALRTLVVCPASLVYNWEKEIAAYTPELAAVVIAGTAAERQELIRTRQKADIWITSYDLLKRDIAFYEKIHFANQIIDEAQFVKNQKTQAAQSVRVVDSEFRMALTGTPIENYLSELWSIMDYLMPGFLFSYARFQADYETPVVAQKDAGALERLRRMVHPFILRRLKKQVLKELPDKLEEAVAVRMEGEQKKLYDASVEEIRAALDHVSAAEFKSGKLEYLAMLTRLRQLCCDPSLLYADYRGGSAKLEACMELVEQALAGGHKLLLFSQFTSMLDIIEARLKEEQIACYRIDGSVSKERRMQMVDAFANDDVPVFLISLKAGGTGLNLTAADIVIHYDPWWNQAAQDQATDRTHRIGQTERVTVYELIVEGSVEERIRRIKEGKARLVEDVLSGGEISSSTINREDMLELLA